MKRVKDFLKIHWDQNQPLLLGYSGGPDSKALLYTLLDCVGTKLHVAHVDHGWREESQEEAQAIRREIEGLKLPYHTTCLQNFPKTNKEEIAREERFLFFRSLFEKYSFQGLLLAHHADDLAETALKRLFEGAHLSHLGGMEEVSTLFSMPVWRPLLKIKKKELLSFLEKRQLQPFFDRTNNDPSYLRARLRIETLPLLRESFGKNLEDNLCLLSARSLELKSYLDQKTAHFKEVEASWGFALCCQGFERIERRHLLQRQAKQRGLILPRTVLEPILDWVDLIGERRKVFFQSRWIVCGRGWVYFLNSDKDRNLTNLNDCLLSTCV